MIQKYIRTMAIGFVAAFALACIGSGPAYAQQKSTTILVPVPQPPQPGSVTGTDPEPPPPPNFQVSHAANL